MKKAKRNKARDYVINMDVENYDIHDPHNEYVWADEQESLSWVLFKIVGGGFVGFVLMVALVFAVLSLD